MATATVWLTNAMEFFVQRMNKKRRREESEMRLMMRLADGRAGVWFVCEG